jgi:small subunit ribosomal protein S1
VKTKEGFVLSIVMHEEMEQQQPRFEGLLEQFLPERTYRGKILHGTVIRIDDDAIIFDVGAKRDAIVSKYEMAKTDPALLDALEKGAQLPLFALRTPAGSLPLEVSIEKARHVVDWERAKELHAEGKIVEVAIKECNRGGAIASFGRLRAFIPFSHIPALRRIRQDRLDEAKENLVGKRMLVKIIEVNRSRRRLIMSARRAQSEARRQRLNSLKDGDIITGTVVNIVDFGAFIDLGGVDGLLHISEIDHSRIEHPTEILKLHDRIEVVVKSVDPERERVSLSRKALLPSS